MEHGYFIEDLEPGMTAMFGKTITDADILMFAGVSGDTNPVHLNEEFAIGTPFKGRIAHGMLTASLISTVIGTKLPGPGCIYLSQTLRFLAPVRAGETVRAVVTVKRDRPGAPPRRPGHRLPRRRSRTSSSARPFMVRARRPPDRRAPQPEPAASAAPGFALYSPGRMEESRAMRVFRRFASCRPHFAARRSPSAISTACIAAIVAVLEAAAEAARPLGGPLGVVTFEPHPREVLEPETAPRRLTLFRTQGRSAAQAGGRPLRRPALRAGADAALAARPSSERSWRSAWVSGAWRPASTSASATSGSGDLAVLGRARPEARLRGPGGAAGEGGRAWSAPRPRSASSWPPATSPMLPGCSAIPSSSTASSARATSAAARSASRPPTSIPLAARPLLPGDRRLCRAGRAARGSGDRMATRPSPISAAARLSMARACCSRSISSMASGTSTGERLRVAFLERLRGELKFAGIDELQEQIARDCVGARAIHAAALA